MLARLALKDSTTSRSGLKLQSLPVLTAHPMIRLSNFSFAHNLFVLGLVSPLGLSKCQNG